MLFFYVISIPFICSYFIISQVVEAKKEIKITSSIKERYVNKYYKILKIREHSTERGSEVNANVQGTKKMLNISFIGYDWMRLNIKREHYILANCKGSSSILGGED